MNMWNPRRGMLAAAILAALPATGAQAHHAMGGTLPSTGLEGFVSGLAHPVIGLDHLAFLLAAGLIAGAARLGPLMPLAFVAASMAGVAAHLLAWDLPAAELLVAFSVVGAGALVAARRTLGRLGAAALFAVAGLFHGYAYGESIVGAEETPLAAYLVGLALVQSAIAIGVAALVARRSWPVTALAPRLAGAVVLGIGLSALAGQLVPA